LGGIQAGNIEMRKYFQLRSDTLTDLPELQKHYMESMSPEIATMKEMIRRIEVAQIAPILHT